MPSGEVAITWPDHPMHYGLDGKSVYTAPSGAKMPGDIRLELNAYQDDDQIYTSSVTVTFEAMMNGPQDVLEIAMRQLVRHAQGNIR